MTIPTHLTDDTTPGLVERPLTAANWVGYALSWFLLAGGATAMFVGFMQVIGVGGMCADGGPYQIEVNCPAGSAVTMTVAPFAIAAAVLIGIFMAQGFGVPAHGYFWSLLFGSLGIGFLMGAFGHDDGIVWAWLICGVVFELMAIPPLFMIRMGWPRSVFGRRRLDGTSLVKHGLPVRDAAVIGAVWLGAASAGFGVALWLT